MDLLTVVGTRRRRALAGGPAGQGVVSELVNSDFDVTISETSGGNETQPTSWGAVEKSEKFPLGTGEGSGSDISYNPNSTDGGIDVTDNTERPAEIGLLHELGHAQDFANGKGDYSPSSILDPDGSGELLEKSEVRVRKFENLGRAEQMLNLRQIKSKQKKKN